METIMQPEPNETERVLMERIQMLMHEEEVYANPNFALTDMAMRLKVERTYIIEAIRKCMNRTLVRYLNECRVIRAMDIMSRPENACLSLEVIAGASGFCDRNRFNSVFEEVTGLTPTEFKHYVDRG